jgi:putative Mg2+ transporter-C (MgtC) family protein
MNEELILLGKVILSGLLAAVVGIEREFAEKPAGLRTHMLIGATSTFLVTMAIRAVETFGPQGFVSTDPVRIIQAIVTGVSFLGAGAILKNVQKGEEQIEGFTTSASILSVAAVGIAIALDDYILAAGVTLWNLFVNWGINYIVERLKGKASDT